MSEYTPISRDSQIRKGVIASVIASLLFVVVIQPLLRLVWSLVLSHGSRFLQGYVDSIYLNAALGHRNYVDVVLLVLVYSASSGLFVGMATVLTRRVIQPDPQPRKPRRYHLVLFWFMVLMFHLAAFYSGVRIYADMQLNTSFQQRIRVLAPRLSDLQMKELEAAWASMQTRVDFLAIQMGMEQIAEQNNIVLPRALWK